MVSSYVILQIWSFLRIMVWAFLFLGTFGTLVYFLLYKYVIELNKQTGSGMVVKRKRARKVADKTGTNVLLTLGGKKYNYPKNEFIYKSGLSLLVRFLEFSDDNYHPMKIEIDDPEHSYFKPIPQNIKFLYKSDQETIRKKYEAKQNFFREHGGLIGVGALCIAFILAVYFMMQEIHGAIDMGNAVISQISALKSQAVTAAPPPA